MKSVSNSKNSWKPASATLLKGKEVFLFDDKEEIVTWGFSKVKTNLPLTFIRCSLNAFGKTAEGFGDGLLLKTALIKAFAEAWERNWMLRVSAQDGSLSGMDTSITSSNGFAAGRNSDEAIANSRNELVERALLLHCWRTQRGWEKCKAQGAIVKLWTAWLRNTRWDISFFRLKDPVLNSALVIIGQHPELGTIVDTQYERDTALTQRKLLLSFLRVLYKPLSDLSKEFPVEGEPDDHEIFYRNPINAKAFGALSNLPNSPLPNPTGIKSILLCEANAFFPAVAVSFNSSWPTLNWGKQSISGENPWPHPLA